MHGLDDGVCGKIPSGRDRGERSSYLTFWAVCKLIRFVHRWEYHDQNKKHKWMMGSHIRLSYNSLSRWHQIARFECDALDDNLRRKAKSHLSILRPSSGHKISKMEEGLSSGKSFFLIRMLFEKLVLHCKPIPSGVSLYDRVTCSRSLVELVMNAFIGGLMSVTWILTRDQFEKVSPCHVYTFEVSSLYQNVYGYAHTP